MAGPDWKKDRLAGADLSRLNMLGRRYLNRGETTALDEAAEYLALCANEEEARQVRWWWNEGCRDYADSEEHLKELNQLLIDRSAELYPKN